MDTEITFIGMDLGSFKLNFLIASRVELKGRKIIQGRTTLAAAKTTIRIMNIFHKYLVSY